MIPKSTLTAPAVTRTPGKTILPASAPATADPNQHSQDLYQGAFPVAPEHELIDRIKRGDADAFQSLYEQHVRVIYRYVSLRLGQPQEAEDVTSETFIRAWQGFPKYEPRQTPVAAWLLRIAHNLVIDRYRKKRPLLYPFHWSPGGGEQHFAKVDNRDVIQKGFETLSYDEQMILYLHYFDEQTIKQIAELLGKTANAVQVAEFRALRKLRKVMGNAE